MIKLIQSFINKVMPIDEPPIPAPVQLTKDDLAKYPRDFPPEYIAVAEQFTEEDVRKAQLLIRLSNTGMTEVISGGAKTHNAYYAIGTGYRPSGKDVAGIVNTSHISRLEGQEKAVAVMKSGLQLLKNVASNQLGGHDKARKAACNIATHNAGYVMFNVLGQEH